jgi:alpha-L-rhamnosidase
VLRRWCGQLPAIQDPQRQVRIAPMAPLEPLHQSGYGSPQPSPLAELPAADNAYTAAATLLVAQYVAATGDARLGQEHLAGILAHLATWPQRPDWPLIDASSHGDHAAIPLRPDDARTAKPLVSAALLLHEHRAALGLAAQLGRLEPELAHREAELAAALRSRYGAEFADPASSQGTLALGLDLGLTADRSASIAALRERLRRDDYRIATGVLLTRTLLRALGGAGLLREAWRLVTREDCPGWLWMLREGPGTVHENLVDTWGFVSRNQPALGVVAEWLLTDLLGLRRDPAAAPGRGWSFTAPDLPELAWARGSVPTPYGPITVAWERHGVQATVDAPAACGIARAG